VRKSLGMLASLAILAILATGCDRAEPPAAKPDPSHTANPRAPRLAVLSPAFAETLRGMGAGDRIVARHGWDSFSPPTIPPVGNEGGIDYESLLKTNPTQVIMEAGAKDPPARLSQLAKDHGWTILRIPNLTLDDIAHATAALANAAGVDPAIATDAADRFNAAFTRDETLAQRAGRALILIGTDPPAVMGPGSFHHEMVERMGADAIPNDGAPFIQWSVEDVLKSDPDTLVLILPGATTDDPAANLGPLAKLNLRCVERKAVVVITDPKAHLPATSLADVAQAARTAILRIPQPQAGKKPPSTRGPAQ
jgi:ABC-type hemin transport system substrate-binding protein